ncbi:MAG TPA: PAS domain S-box protein, partial [Kofleriaceae bacterium]|nr:PAS domain S-box protein [Kofleriaceae bacterium]
MERHEHSVARPGRSRLGRFAAGVVAFSRWPLRAKLAASFLVVSLLPVAVIALVEVRETVRRIFDDETELLAARAEQLAEQIDAFHLGYRRAAIRLAAAEKVIELLHAPAEDVEQLAAAQANRLHSHLTVDTAVRGIAVIGPDRRVVAATEPALAHRELGRSSYLRDALVGTTAISDIFVAEHEVGDVPTIGYASPVRGATGNVIGAVVFWIRADALWELAQQANGRSGAGSFAVILDHDGIRLADTGSPGLVFHPAGPLASTVVDRLVAEQRFGPRTRELLGDVRPFPEPFARACAAAFDPGLFEGVPPSEPHNHYGVGRRLRLVPWTVFQLVPAALLAAPVGNAVRRHVVFAVLVGLIALIAGGAFARQIAAPLAGLTAATRRLARGERGVRVEFGTRDELGALGAAFNALADELYQSRTGLEALVGQRTAALVDANRELRQREHSLVASEQRFRDLYEKSPDMYLTTDVATLQIVDCNQTLCRQLGYERAELLGRPTHAVYPPGDAALVSVRMAEFLTARGELTDLERVLQCKDGRQIHTSLSASPIRDRDGKIVQARMVWRDISSRKRAESDRQFLLGLADVLRSSTEPGEVLRSVCAQLASYL